MAVKNLNVDWKKWYKDHLTDTHGAAQAIKKGDVVWMGQGAQIPYDMLDDMNEHMDDYNDVFLMWNCSLYPFELLMNPETVNHFRLTSMFDVVLERMSQGMGIMENNGNGYDHVLETLTTYGCNTVAFHILPPDENGYCNFGHYGCSNGEILSHMPSVTKKIAFIDKTGMCPMRGDRDFVSIHISEFDYIVEDADTEMIVYPAPGPTPVDEKIAKYIIPYLKNGDKIEIGWGGLGEEILNNLRGTGQYEIFSEVFCETMMPAVLEGTITSITACSPGACSLEFFDFCMRDERVHLLPMTKSINLEYIDKQENMVAINSTFMVDLLGQGCSEAQGLKPYSGAGGSLAYIYGAFRAPGGRSFVSLRSVHTDENGEEVSNIVPWLPEGCIVTTPKNVQMYIVSEWGVADVYLKTIPDRVKALLKIAHPKYRKWLYDSILSSPLVYEKDFPEDFDLFDNVAPEDMPK